MKRIKDLKQFEILDKSMQQTIGGREVNFVGDADGCFKVVTKNNGEFVKIKYKKRYQNKC